MAISHEIFQNPQAREALAKRTCQVLNNDADKNSAEKPGKPRSRWRTFAKRLGWTVLILLGILIVFHRPIVFEGTRYFVVRAAKQQHLDLTYEMKGSIFSTLSVANLKAVPTEPGPIQRLEIGTVNLRYSLWDLIRNGLPAFLKEVGLRDVYVELTPGEPLPPKKEEEPQAIKFPAIFPETLDIANVNVLVHAPTGDTVVEGFYFSLLPDKPGALKLKTLDIPGVRRWTDIDAATTYRDRNLVLSALRIGPEIDLAKFQLDMSDLEKSELRVALDGRVFDSPLKLDAKITDLNAANNITLKAGAGPLVFEPVWKYLNMPAPVLGELESFSAEFAGSPEKPAGWTGKITAGLKGLSASGQALGDVVLDLTLGNRRAVVVMTDRFDEKNNLRLDANAALPETLDAFVRTSAEGTLILALPEIGRLPLPEPVAGDLAVKADFRLAGGKVEVKAAVDSATLAVAGAELGETHFTLGLEKDLTQPADAPVFRTLASALEGGIATLKFQDYTADALRLKVSSKDAVVALEDFSVTKKENLVRASADYVLPDDMKTFDAQPLNFLLAVDAPNLSAFLADDAAAQLSGRLKVDGGGAMKNRVLDGNFSVNGSEIVAGGLPVKTVNAKIAIEKNNANVSALEVVINDKNKVLGYGGVDLLGTRAYWGSLDVLLDDLSVFAPLLATPLGGKLALHWKGNGNAAASPHYGNAQLDLTKAQFGDQKNLAAHFNAYYTPEYFELPDFTAKSDLADAGFALGWKNNRLSLTNLAVRQKKLTLLEGSIDAPLHLAEAAKLDKLLPTNEPLSVKLRTRDLSLRTLFNQLGEKNPPITGTVNLTVDANGTIDDLIATVALRATQLQSTAAENFAPADVSLNLVAKDDRLGIDGTVRQKLIQPLRITGDMPLDPTKVLQAGALDPSTPVKLAVSLPRSSLAFVSSLVPMVRQSRGTAAIDVRLDGTIGAPRFDGTVQADLEALRFTDPSLPPVNAFVLRMNFTRDQLRFERCQGVIAGGTFQVGGGIGFKTLDNPVFDLRLGARNALVLQNDDMTARISSDLRVTGPLNAGNVQGTVWVTRSRFFKNIDILPIGLPGRPAPQPPPEPTVISFPNPPLRDWRFDIAIKTADPFLVQSNLANGRIFIDLHLGGTGLEPWMDGTINIERLVASLPFSRLTIESGQVFFTRQAPFVPQLNLRGNSTIRDYDVSVFITGPVTDPNAVFTSQPPLPQAEVVSLLATGMTTSELGRDPNALAGRAAILVFQKLYNSIFRRNRPPAENESFLSRIQFDIGSTDPKTGRQSTTLGIPLSDRITLTGGLDVGGNFKGQVKYLIRFK